MAMTTPDTRIRQAVLAALAAIAPEADLSAVPDGANLRREFDLDSIDFQNFLIRLSKDLAVHIPDRDAAGLTTLAACIAYLSARAG